MGSEEPKKSGASKKGGARAKGARARERFLEAFRSHGNLARACTAAGWASRAAYDQSIQRHPEFRAACDDIRAQHAAIAKVVRRQAPDEDEPDDDESGFPWQTDKVPDFETFREHYFGFVTQWFHREMINLYETLPLGWKALILLPPESGKTSLFEDYACYKLAYWPQHRFMVASEAETLARRIIRRVQNRMEPDGPYPLFARQRGPFVPERGTGRVTRQPWGAHFFNVRRKTVFDEREYSMECRGITGQIAGARTDHLHLDDVQSLKSAAFSQTEKRFQIFRQDWLSRPGVRGITTVNGTRVASDDFYIRCIEEWQGKRFQLIKYPAIVDHGNGPEPLWRKIHTFGPDCLGHVEMDLEELAQVSDLCPGYTMEELDILQENVGEEAWSRNYMQEPEAADTSFTKEIIELMKDSSISSLHTPEPDAVGLIGLDPSIGGITSVTVAQAFPERFLIRKIREKTSLMNNKEICELVIEEVRNFNSKGGRVLDVVIEENAFQKGLIREDVLLDASKQYGFQIWPHSTNKNKYSEEIGVASMAGSAAAGEIKVAFADDAITQAMMKQFFRQCKAWQPGRSGTSLRQDQVMSTWFPWIKWRDRYKRKTKQAIQAARPDSGPPKTRALPWTPTSVPLGVR